MNSQNKTKKSITNFQSAQSLFSGYKLNDAGGYISREFQDYGYRLAMELDDLRHKSLYIKMAKEYDRVILEKALSFVSDANAQSKAKLFMWKVKQLRKIGPNQISSKKDEK
ncbi:MAG: hypothetical protein ACOZAN_01570 [Patescibacteria group bacterium]